MKEGGQLRSIGKTEQKIVIGQSVSLLLCVGRARANRKCHTGSQARSGCVLS